MSTDTLAPELASMAAFRASLCGEAGGRDSAERLCAVGHYCRLARGAMLWSNREQDRLVFVASGSAKLIANRGGRDGPAAEAAGRCPPRGQILAFHFPGDIVSLRRQADRDFRLVALCDAELVIFPAEQFLEIAEGDPAILRSVLARSLEALHRSRTRMMQLGHKSARQRIADFLVTLSLRLGSHADGTCEINLPMSRSDIADCLGLTLETVSRQFAELREAGLVSTKGRSLVRLTDVEALAREAGQPPPGPHLSRV